MMNFKCDFKNQSIHPGMMPLAFSAEVAGFAWLVTEGL